MDNQKKASRKRGTLNRTLMRDLDNRRKESVQEGGEEQGSKVLEGQDGQGMERQEGRVLGVQAGRSMEEQEGWDLGAQEAQASEVQEGRDPEEQDAGQGRSMMEIRRMKDEREAGEVRVNRRKREPVVRKGTLGHHVMEYGLLLLGSMIIALSFNLFLRPNQVASGGVTGLSIIVQHLMGVQPAITQWLLNIPLFLAGLWLLGRQFGLKAAVGSFVLPLFVLLTSHVHAHTIDLLLASIYGGIGVGVGLGLVFRGRGSTGGMDLAAQLIHKYTGISLGISVALLDGMVILSAGLVFNAEKALFALIGLYVTSKTIDVVQMGFGYAKVAFIISDETEAIAEAVLHDLDRGLTKLHGEGGFTGVNRQVLMVVVSQTEVTRLKELVKTVDPTAFVIISETHEVLGEGFKLPV